MIDEQIEDLRVKVLSLPPSIEMLEEAEMIAAAVADDDLPIWVAMLANGNPVLYAEAVDEAKRWMPAESTVQVRPGDARGQMLVEVAVGLFLIAVLCIAFWAWFTTTPAYMSYLALTADAATELEIVVDQSMSHGLPRHGGKAQAVYDCIEKNGIFQVWYNPITKRHANLCQVDDGRWGAQIVNEANEEITAFINKCKEFADFEKYLQNAGYVPPQ